MKIIDRYITKTLLNYIFIVAGIWLLIFSFFDLLADIKNIGIHDYSVIDAFYVQMLNAPATIYRSSIVIILIASVLALGNLAANSELIIARSSGKSIVNIVLTSTVFCTMVMIGTALLSELYAVDLKNKGIEYKQTLLNKHVAGKQDLWLKEGKYIINIKNNYNDNSFGNLTLFYIKDNTLQNVLSAKGAIIRDNTLVLNQVVERNFDVNDFWTKQYDGKILDIAFTKNTIDMFKEQSKNISAFDIYRHTTFLAKNNVEDKSFSTELYTRIVKPMILAITIIFAALFVFTSLRDSSMGKKIFLAVVVSLFFELTLRISGSLVVKFDYNYFYIVVIPLFVLLVAVLVALVKKSNE